MKKIFLLAMFFLCTMPMKEITAANHHKTLHRYIGWTTTSIISLFLTYLGICEGINYFNKKNHLILTPDCLKTPYGDEISWKDIHHIGSDTIQRDTILTNTSGNEIGEPRVTNYYFITLEVSPEVYKKVDHELWQRNIHDIEKKVLKQKEVLNEQQGKYILYISEMLFDVSVEECKKSFETFYKEYHEGFQNTEMTPLIVRAPISYHPRSSLFFCATALTITIFLNIVMAKRHT